MRSKRKLRGLALTGHAVTRLIAAATLVLCGGFTQAAIVTWTFAPGTFVDGGTIKGSFVYETIGKNPWTWDFTVTPGTFPGTPFTTEYRFTPTTSSWNSAFSGLSNLSFFSSGGTPQRFVRFEFADPGLILTQGTLSVTVTESITTGQTRSLFGEVTAVPEPSALGFTLIGVALLAAVWLRKRDSTREE
jgi:hypothetical protein